MKRGRALPLIAGLLVAAAVTRLAGADIAAARDGARMAGATAQGQPECPPPPDLAEVMAALDARAERLDARAAAIADRRQALRLAEEAALARLAVLEAAEAALRETVAIAADAAEDDVARLTAVYENMKAKDAADLFATMAPGFAAGFLARMRPDAAAAVMSGLEPETAYAISVILAGRNAGAPGD